MALELTPIARMCKELRYSQKYIATRAKLPTTTISHAYRHNTSMRVLILVAMAFKVSPQWMLTGNGPSTAKLNEQWQNGDLSHIFKEWGLDEGFQYYAWKMKAERRSRNYLLRNVSNDTGIAVTTLSAYEVGRRVPKLTPMMKLAEYLGLSLNGFLGFE